MTQATHFPAVFDRFLALEAALRQTSGFGSPEFARRLSALALLGADGAPDDLAERVRATSGDLRGAWGVPGQARPVFAAALVTTGRRAHDYVQARDALLPVMRGKLRVSLPAAALAYAATGRTQLDDAHLARIASIATLIRTPWWSSSSARTGFLAATLALSPDRLDAIEARVAAARGAMSDAGASDGMVRETSRDLALAGVEPVAVARTWAALDDMRRTRRRWGGVKPAMLMSVATTGARPDEAATALDAAHAAVNDLRPHIARVARPYVTVALAARTLAPEADVGNDAVAALQAVIATVSAAAAATTVVIAASTASSSGP